MASFVIRDKALAAITHHAVLFLRTSHHPFDGITDFVVADFAQVTTSRKNRCLVEQIGQISAGVAGGSPRHLVEINIL